MDKFKEMIANDEFIEHCQVHDKMYGTAKEQITKIQAAKKIPLLDIDVQGAIKFEKVFPDSNFVAVLPTSQEILAQRIRSRGKDTEEVLQTRVANAQAEMEELVSRKKTFTYRVINDELEVSKRVCELLLLGLYAEELSGLDTDTIIAETPLLKEVPKSNFLFKFVVFAGIVSAGAYLYYKKK